MIDGMLRFVRFIFQVFRLAEDAHLTLISAGVAFFGLFAIFPGMAALIAIFGLLADPAVVSGQLDLMEDVIPAEALGLFDAQLDRLLSAPPDTLGLATLISIALAIWSARAGVAALMRGLNVIHGDKPRSGLKHYSVALALTICLIGISVAALLVVVIAPLALAFLPLSDFAGRIIALLRWVVALFIPFAALGLLYRFGPNLRGARPDWITPGAFLVVVSWLAASMGFSAYLTNFGNYNEVYGSIGAVIALLMWFYISAYLILLGAVLNVALQEPQRTGRLSDANKTHSEPN